MAIIQVQKGDEIVAAGVYFGDTVTWEDPLMSTQVETGDIMRSEFGEKFSAKLE